MQLLVVCLIVVMVLERGMFRIYLLRRISLEYLGELETCLKYLCVMNPGSR